ncbi:NAD-dependent succinate-semialdehyde dehydrogenase [Micromonospora radicis]|uniref:NAD-dependent succinate-semialdehyde dehydrogenase n=1 Tax=Micromonospora radicis TaxID=1894971 RepID=A0A418MXA0_9ACTN|nr:NAD-dependent succinate-semialdehyde dehydrogenase [Micromonospora radicis]RIV39212.1 NAD-dependent succinate-semialdehyde dehydrogenase [Micromonospora radicis]
MAYPTLGLHIDGEWIGPEGHQVRPVVDPATGAVLADLPLAGQVDLDRALAAAARGFERWRRTPPQHRGAVLKEAARLLRERAEHIAVTATLEQGKAVRESRVEVAISANLLEWAGEETTRLYGRVLARPGGTRSLVLRQPVGPVAAFAPWNFPIANPARKLASALAAGCSVILKPAEETPGAAIEVLRALVDAGLPPGVAQLVFGVPDQVSRHLLASPVIRKVSFTGSVAVGRHLMRLAADGLLRTTMELGGHAPVLVFADADLEHALDVLVAGKYRNAGQVCVAPTRFYVQEGVLDTFVDGFLARVARLRVGHGLDEQTVMGPVANPRRDESLHQLVTDAQERGATRLTGGRRAGLFWDPVVLTEVPPDARIMVEEPFGPVASISSFRTLDEAIALANRLPYALAAFAWSESARTVLAVGDGVEAGMVGINTDRISGADSPFGGMKHSGHGSEDGPEGIEAYLATKAIHQS